MQNESKNYYYANDGKQSFQNNSSIAQKNQNQIVSGKQQLTFTVYRSGQKQKRKTVKFKQPQKQQEANQTEMALQNARKLKNIQLDEIENQLKNQKLKKDEQNAKEIGKKSKLLNKTIKGQNQKRSPQQNLSRSKQILEKEIDIIPEQKTEEKLQIIYQTTTLTQQQIGKKRVIILSVLLGLMILLTLFLCLFLPKRPTDQEFINSLLNSKTL